jgi:hypothetical protein
MKYKRRVLPVAYVFLLCCIFPRLAYCYIDPGTGSFVLQILMSVVLSVVLALGKFWKNVKQFVAKSFFSPEKE